MPAKKGVVVEEAPEFTPEEMAAAAAQIPAVAVNAEAHAAEAGAEETSAAEKEAPPAAAEETPPPPETAFDLRRPVEHEGETYERVELDRARLTGEVTVKAERLFLIECPRFPADANRLDSMAFWQIVASFAAGIPYAVVKKMDLLDAWRLAGDAKELFFES